MSHEGRLSLAHRAESDPRVVDRAIAALAGRQRGIVSRRQLLALGLSDQAIGRRKASDRLMSVHAGVYAVGHRALPWGWREVAAVLACGEDAALSHRSAGVWLGLLGAWSGPVHVTIPRSSDRARDGIVVHRCRSLLPRDVAVHDGLRCTTPARTLVDLSATAPRLLPRALREAEVQHLDVGNVRVLLAEQPRRRGARALRAALAAFDPGTADARSPLEHDALDLIRGAGLPPMQANVLVCGHLVDLLWPREKVVVELDGRRTHDTPSAFEEDRRRDIALQLAATWCCGSPRAGCARSRVRVVGELAAALAARGAVHGG
jgi:hypothetical protein